MTITVDEIIYNIFVFVFVIVASVLITKIVGKLKPEDEEIMEDEIILEEQYTKGNKKSELKKKSSKKSK
ncbi:MAG: hypothetical protein U9N49_10605 [Campylobacterota bacterium]|nr:hypothetical protein [Campylobacterota bacterium]